MRKAVVMCAAAAAILASGARADAAQCTIAAAPVLFGTYDVFTPAALDSVGNVVLNCTGNARNVMITINSGQGGTFALRKMFLNAAEWLGYNLYRNAARSIVWGDGTGGTSAITAPFVPNNSDIPVPVYGRVTPGQDVRAGAYGDNLTVTINF